MSAKKSIIKKLMQVTLLMRLGKSSLTLFSFLSNKSWFPAMLIVALSLWSVLLAPTADAAIVYVSAASGRNDALPTNGTAGAMSITRPVNATPGMALIASIAARPTSMTWTAPPGWVLMTATNQPSGGSSTAPGGMSLLTYYKIVTTSEPNSYTWTFANPSNAGGSAVGGILSFSGIDTSASPIDVWSAKLTASGTTHSTTAITTTVANTMVVSSISFLSASSFNNPTGSILTFTERLDQSAPVASNAVGTTIQMSTAPMAATGNTGTSSATTPGSADNGVGHLMALKPSTRDLTLTMNRSGPLNPGGTASYTLTITNAGSVSEPGALTIVDTLPAGLGYASASGGWTCSAVAQVVTCTLSGALAAGASASALVLNVNVSAGATGILTNTATASGTGGDGNTANNTAVDTYVISSTPYAYYAMDESSWGTITDSSGNGRNATKLGTASATGNPPPSAPGPGAAVTGSPGTCGAGKIPSGTTAIGVDTAIDVNSIGNTGTIMFWYSSNTTWNDGNARMLFDASNELGNGATSDKHFFLVKDGAGILRFALEDSADLDSTAATVSYGYPANEWHHIAVTWDMGADALAIYVDGNTVPAATSATNVNGTLGDMATLYLGAQRYGTITGTPAGYTSNTSNGYIDEVRIYSKSLLPLEIADAYSKTHACTATGVAPDRFNCIASGAAADTGHLYTKLAGTNFSFDVAALKADGTVETGYVAGSNKDVTVELFDDSSSPAPACNAYASPVSAQTLSFASTDAGRKATASFNVANAYAKLRCRVKDETASPTIYGCSTDDFSVRPTTLTVTSTDATADGTGASTTATPAIKAGASFNLTATALAGYNGTPKIDATKAAASSGVTGVLAGSFSAAAVATGVASGSAFSYGEVGYFNFGIDGVYDDTFTAVDQASDCTNDFSNALVGGKYGCKFGNTAATTYFGRFIPDHFDSVVSQVSNVPMPCPAGLACPTTYNGFVYSAQPFTLTVTARNTSGGTTVNYNTTTGFSKTVALGAWGALGSTTVSPSGAGALGVTSLSAFASGIASSSTEKYTFTATPTAPTEIYIRATESGGDGVTTLRATPSSSVEGGVEVVSGRVKVSNTYGSELLPLTVTATLQYWGGTSTGYVTSTTDNVNTVTAAKISRTVCGICSATLGTINSVVSVPALPPPYGVFAIKLNAPGAGITGYEDLTVSIGGWPSYLPSSTGRATFGVYKGRNDFIYQRESY